MAIRICPECGGKCTTTRKDCPHCGHLFVETKKCPECESEVPADAKECPECGYFFEAPAAKEEKKPEPSITASEALNAQKATEENTKVKIVSMTCPNCGCAEAIDLGNDKYKCTRCDSTFAYNKGPQTVITGDVVVKQEFGDTGYIRTNEFVSVISGEYEKTEEEAKAAVVDMLAHNEKMPSDILDMKFRSIEKVTGNALVAEADFDVSYSLSVGYDREETYIDFEEKRDSHGNKYKEPVTKTRTVTDWKLQSGNANGNFAAPVWLDASEGYASLDEFKPCNYIYEKCKGQAKPYGGALRPDSSALEIFEAAGARRIYRDSVGFPGNHQKDERQNWIAHYKDLQLVEVPLYLVVFQYRGKDYSVYVSACGEISAAFAKNAPVPQKTDDDLKFEEQIKAFEKHSGIVQHLELGFGIGIIVLSLFLAIALSSVMTDGSSFYIATAAPVGIVLIIFSIIRSKRHFNLSFEVEYAHKTMVEGGMAPRYNQLMASLGSDKKMEVYGKVPTSVKAPGNFCIFELKKAFVKRCVSYSLDDASSSEPAAEAAAPSCEDKEAKMGSLSIVSLVLKAVGTLSLIGACLAPLGTAFSYSYDGRLNNYSPAFGYIFGGNVTYDWYISTLIGTLHDTSVLSGTIYWMMLIGYICVLVSVVAIAASLALFKKKSVAKWIALVSAVCAIAGALFFLLCPLCTENPNAAGGGGYDFYISDEQFGVWGVTLFAGIAAVCGVVSFILDMLKKKSAK